MIRRPPYSTLTDTLCPNTKLCRLQMPGGQIGDLPSSGETELNAAILTQSHFTTPEQFGNIILRANPDGSAVTLSDVARVELGAQTYLFDSELNGKPVDRKSTRLNSSH